MHPDTGKPLLIDPFLRKQVNLKPCEDYELVCQFAGAECRGYILQSKAGMAGITPYWTRNLVASSRGKDIVHPKILESLANIEKQNPLYVPPKESRAAVAKEKATPKRRLKKNESATSKVPSDLPSDLEGQDGVADPGTRDDKDLNKEEKSDLEETKPEQDPPADVTAEAGPHETD